MDAGNKKTILSTDGLAVGYRTHGGSNILLKDLRLELRRGELVCFMGPNGAGKSSLIRTLAGLQKPLGGAIHIDTNNLELPKNIAVVLTNRLEGVRMTVRELITYGRYPYLDWNVSLSES